MKKAISLILVALVLIMTLASCDIPALPTDNNGNSDSNSPTDKPTEGSTDGISKEEWEEAIAYDKFDNITISSEIDYEENSMGAEDGVQTIKISDGKVYRAATFMGEPFSICFTGDDAEAQRKMFTDVFLSLLAERDNYVYDPERKIYTAPEKISVTVTPREGISDLVEMESGEVRFDEHGRLVYFACTLTETLTTTVDGHTTSTKSPKGTTVWTFSNYGSTVITAEEEASGSLDDLPGATPENIPE